MKIIIKFKRDERPIIENKIDKGLFSVCNSCKWRKPKRPCAARYNNFYYNNIRPGQTKLKKNGFGFSFPALQDTDLLSGDEQKRDSCPLLPPISRRHRPSQMVRHVPYSLRPECGFFNSGKEENFPLLWDTLFRPSQYCLPFFPSSETLGTWGGERISLSFVTCCWYWVSLPRSHENRGWLGKVGPSPLENDLNLPVTLIQQVTPGLKEHFWFWSKINNNIHIEKSKQTTWQRKTKTKRSIERNSLISFSRPFLSWKMRKRSQKCEKYLGYPFT